MPPTATDRMKPGGLRSQTTKTKDPMINCDYCSRQLNFRLLRILPNGTQICPDCEERLSAARSAMKSNPLIRFAHQLAERKPPTPTPAKKLP